MSRDSSHSHRYCGSLSIRTLCVLNVITRQAVSIKGSSKLLITPHYDGYPLAGVHEVAGNGLSVISIKGSHRKCKISASPNSKQAQISCAQGIKARNSFRNLLKPDLRKVKDLECATTGSLTQLLQTHNLDNPGKSSKRKVLRILESLVTKKPKTVIQPEPLRHLSSPLAADSGVLSSFCLQKEVEQKSKMQFQENFSVTLDDPINDQTYELIEEQSDHKPTNTLDNLEICTESCPLSAVTIDKAYSSSTIMQVNTSNNTLLSTEVIPETTSINQTLNLHPNENTQSPIYESVVESPNAQCINTLLPDIVPEDENASAHINACLSKNGACENPSKEVVQSIFTDIFTEMQEIDDYISSYVSSFCVREEEFQNYPALTRKSSEVVSHFFDQVHNSNKIKLEQHKPDIMKSTSSNELNNTLYIKGVESEGITSMKESVSEIKEIVNIDVNMKMKDPHNFTEEINYPKTDNNFASGGQGYCYWDDLVTHGQETFFGQYSIDTNILDKHNVLNYNDSSIVPLNFFEGIWYELIGCTSNELLGNNTCKNVYNGHLVAETKTALQSLDIFLENGCFPSQSINPLSINTCTIIEIDNTCDHLELINASEISKSLHNIEYVRDVQEDTNTNSWCSGNENLYRDVFTHRSQRSIKVSNNEYEERDLNLLPDMQDVTRSSVFNDNQIVDTTNLNGFIKEIENNKYGSDIQHLSENNDKTELKDMIKNLNRQLKKNSSYNFIDSKENTSYLNKQYCVINKSSVNVNMKSNKNQEYKVETSTIEVPISYKLSSDLGKKSSLDVPLQVSEPQSLEKTPNEEVFGKRSAFVRNVEKESTLSNNENSNFLFSSPRLQLNLTNTLVNHHKK